MIDTAQGSELDRIGELYGVFRSELLRHIKYRWESDEDFRERILKTIKDLNKNPWVECKHFWKTTQGFTNSYEDCIHCGAKKEEL